MTGAYPKRKQTNRQKRFNKSLIRVIDIIPKDQSILDVGASAGLYVKALLDKGYTQVKGIDGTEGIKELSNGLVLQYDLVTSDTSFLHADWILFFEVGEHIPIEHEQMVISKVSCMALKGIILSWAIPSQRGWQHVNTRTPAYVASQFAKRGWYVDDELTRSAQQTVEGKHLKQSLMVLRK